MRGRTGCRPCSAGINGRGRSSSTLHLRLPFEEEKGYRFARCIDTKRSAEKLARVKCQVIVKLTSDEAVEEAVGSRSSQWRWPSTDVGESPSHERWAGQYFAGYRRFVLGFIRLLPPARDMRLRRQTGGSPRAVPARLQARRTAIPVSVWRKAVRSVQASRSATCAAPRQGAITQRQEKTGHDDPVRVCVDGLRCQAARRQ